MIGGMVSVVIPNYNYGDYVKQAIDSALAQTYSNIEVIVIDDGSKDSSPAILASYGDRIRWVAQANSGVSAARNRGIELSRGEFVAFLDADDYWSPQKIAKQVARFANPDVALVFCGMSHVDRGGNVLESFTRNVEGRILRNIALMDMPSPPGIGTTGVVRSSALRTVGLFDIRLSGPEDWDMLRRIASHFEVAYVPEALASYRLHGSGLHLDVARYEQGQTLILDKMFSDPAASEIHHLSRRSYARLHSTLSGLYLNARRPLRAITHALTALWLSPSTFPYIAMTPIRRAKRLVGLRGTEAVSRTDFSENTGTRTR